MVKNTDCKHEEAYDMYGSLRKAISACILDLQCSAAVYDTSKDENKGYQLCQYSSIIDTGYGCTHQKVNRSGKVVYICNQHIIFQYEYYPS